MANNTSVSLQNYQERHQYHSFGVTKNPGRPGLIATRESSPQTSKQTPDWCNNTC